MPVYHNPNSHAVYLSLSHPNTVLLIYPAAWSAARVPKGGKQEVVLDDTIARPMVRLGQLAEVTDKRVLILPVGETPPPSATPEPAPAAGPPEPIVSARAVPPASKILLMEMSEDAQLARFKKEAKARSDSMPCERASTDPRGGAILTEGTAALNPEMVPAQLPPPANQQDEPAKPKKRFSL